MLVDNIIADIYACAGALCANYCVLMSQFIDSLPADRKNKNWDSFSSGSSLFVVNVSFFRAKHVCLSNFSSLDSSNLWRR